MRLLMIILICLLLQGCNPALLRGITRGIERATMNSQERQMRAQEEYQEKQLEVLCDFGHQGAQHESALAEIPIGLNDHGKVILSGNPAHYDATEI